MNRILFLAALALVGCKNDYGGTSVGNPGKAAMTVAEGLDVTTTEAFTGRMTVSTVDCKGVESVVLEGTDINLLEPLIFTLPDQAICGLAVDLIDPVRVLATGDAGGSVDLTLEAGFVDLPIPRAQTLDAAYAIEFGSPGWLNALDLNLPAAGDVVITPADPDHLVLFQRWQDESGVFADDGDGRVSDTERTAGPLNDPEDDDDD